MVNPHVAFQRQIRFLKAHKVEREDQLQFIVYTRNWTRPAEPADGDLGAIDQQQFPSTCTLLLGVVGTCTPTGQPQNPLLLANDRWRVSFQYNANSLGLVTPFGVQGASATTVFGQFGDQFPAREIAMEANDTIQQTIQNITPDVIRGSLSYHCLVYKYAQ